MKVVGSTPAFPIYKQEKIIMDRRNFLKNLAFITMGTAAFAKAQEVQASIPESLDDSFHITNYFQFIKMKAGELPEFPIDFLVDNNDLRMSYINKDYKKPERYMDYDSIIIPTYDVAVQSPTYRDITLRLEKKVNYDAATLLLMAGLDNPIIKSDNRDNLEALMRTQLRRNLNQHPVVMKSVKLKTFTFGKYIIGVNLYYKDSFVCPVREEPTVFYSPKSEASAWCEYGLSVLDGRLVVAGVLS
jgi:hypothetical protein